LRLYYVATIIYFTQSDPLFVLLQSCYFWTWCRIISFFSFFFNNGFDNLSLHCCWWRFRSANLV